MKHIILIIVIGAFSLNMNAQEKIKQKELGITFSSFNSFGFSFKTGTEKSLWRFNTIIAQGDYNKEDSTNYTNNRIILSLGFGKEFIKEITENLELKLGADIGFSFQQYKLNQNDNSIDNLDIMRENIRYSPGIYFVFGINYVFNNFIVGAEILPGVSYSYTVSKDNSYYINDGNEFKSEYSNFNYGLSNNSIKLSLAYRF